MTEILFKPARKEEEWVASQKETVSRTGKQLGVRSNRTQDSLLAHVCLSQQAGLLSPERCPPRSLGVAPRSSRTHLRVQRQQGITALPSVPIKETAGEDQLGTRAHLRGRETGNWRAEPTGATWLGGAPSVIRLVGGCRPRGRESAGKGGWTGGKGSKCRQRLTAWRAASGKAAASHGPTGTVAAPDPIPSVLQGQNRSFRAGRRRVEQGDEPTQGIPLTYTAGAEDLWGTPRETRRWAFWSCALFSHFSFPFSGHCSCQTPFQVTPTRCVLTLTCPDCKHSSQPPRWPAPVLPTPGLPGSASSKSACFPSLPLLQVLPYTAARQAL